MWLFTETGFISSVRHQQEKGILVARSRDDKSLASLSNFAGLEIQNTGFRDYPYRVHVQEGVFVSWLIKQIENIEYTNFKDRVYETRGHDFADVLMSVWSVMHDVEDHGARK